MRIVAFEGDKLSGLAEKYSRENNCLLHIFANYDAFDSKIISDYTAIFIEPQQITEALVMKTNMPGIHSKKFCGFITGLSEQDVQQKIDLDKISKTFSADRTAILMRPIDRTIDHCTRFDVITRYGLNLQIMKKISSYSIISAMLDGNRRHLHVNDGFICGVNRDILIDELKIKYPECTRYNQSHCGEDKIYADEFITSCFFLNSCSSSLIGTSLAGNQVNVPMNLNKSCRTLISGFRPKEGNENENLLFALLINQGYSTGETLYVLNMNSYYCNSDYYPFILFGFPDQKAPNLDETKEVFFEVQQIGNNYTLKVEAKDVNIFEANFYYPSEAAQRKIMDRECIVHFQGVANDGAYYALIPYENYAKLLIYSWNELSMDGEVIIELSASDSFASVLKRRLDNLRKLTIMGFRHKKLLNQIHNYEQILGVYIRISNKRKYTLNHKEMEKIKCKIDDEEKAIAALIIGEIERQGNNFFFEKYQNNTYIRSAEHELHQKTQCPYCDNYLFMKKSSNKLYELNRISAFCSECHNVFDAESGDDKNRLQPFPFIANKSSDDTHIVFEIYCSTLHSASKTAVYISIWAENRSETKQLSIHMSENPYFSTGEPQEQRIVFSIEKKDKLIHQKQFCLYCYWIEDFGISIGTRPFIL